MFQVSSHPTIPVVGFTNSKDMHKYFAILSASTTFLKNETPRFLTINKLCLLVMSYNGTTTGYYYFELCLLESTFHL